MIPLSQPLFETGAVILTPGVKALARRGYIDPNALLNRHRRGDWGEIDALDRYTNERGLQGKDRLVSCYQVVQGVSLEIWTMIDRSMTVLLLLYE